MKLTTDSVTSYFDSLPQQRVVPTIEPGYLAPQIPSHPPEDPEPWSQIQSDIETKIKPGITHWQSPNFMAFYPANVTYPSILGEMYSAAFTAPAFNWICSPACTELETIVMDWVARALALPACFRSDSETRGGGVIQVSASDAIATVMVAARERRVRELVRAEGAYTEGTDAFEDRAMDLRPRLVALGSDQAHSSTAKGALIAGTRYRSARARLADNLELTGPALREVLETCAQQGLTPYYLTLTMGTTSTCAIDRVAEITAVLGERPEWRRIWVHIDAAYAGAALVADEYQGLARDWAVGVDSFTMNMHKWLLVNFDANCLFVRQRDDLINALDVTPAYLRNTYSDAGQVIDYRNWSISLGRRFRALKIWFVMRSYGLSGLKAHIRRTIELGDMFAELVQSRSDLFEIITRPAFCLTVLRVRASAPATDRVQTEESSNALTKQVYELVNARGEVFLTSSVVAGIYAIRVVSASPATDEGSLRKAFDILVRTTEEVLPSGSIPE